MKIRSFISTATMSFALLIVGCGDSDKEPPIPLKKASVTVEVTSFDAGSATIEVNPKDAEKCAYVYKLESEGVPSAEAILSIGTSLTPAGQQTINLEPLESETTYVIGIAVVGEDKDVVMVTKSFTTLKSEQTTDFIDGFMFYDGRSETTGKYTMTIVLSSKMINDSETESYCDLLIFASMREPLTSSGGGLYKVPYGTYTPFYREESLQTNLMYDIGKHRIDPESGEPNFSGSAWIVCEKGVATDDIFVADDTENTHVMITDNEDGTYNIHGVMVDKTRGEKMEFSHTGSKLVMGGF